ncbi:hypothetical protein JCM5350_002159 [Sporobolomyces pararoseus]
MSTTLATTYLITGASRGLGLGYTKQLLKSGFRVVAAVRDPVNGIDQLRVVKEEYGDRLLILGCDVTIFESVQEAARQLESSRFIEGGGLDVLIANAGVLGGGFKTPLEFSIQDLQYSLDTNLYGVINSIKGFLPLLRKKEKKQIFVTSSEVGSFGGKYQEMIQGSAYSISKTAVNMYLKKLSIELASEGFTVIPFSPGYVNTDLNSAGGANGDLEVPEASEFAIKNVFLPAKKEMNGKF